MFREAQYEEAVLEILTELDYEYLYGPDIERDACNPLLMGALIQAISNIITEEKIINK